MLKQSKGATSTHKMNSVKKLAPWLHPPLERVSNN